MLSFITQLKPEQEKQFKDWYKAYAEVNSLDQNPDSPEHYYDYRGFWLGDNGATQLQRGMHLPDTYKTPGHPTFSLESKYAVGPFADMAGRWESGVFVYPRPTIENILGLGHGASKK